MRPAELTDRITSIWNRLPKPQQRILLGITATGTLTATLLITLWPDSSPPRAREYLTTKACLLTGSQGIADPAAAPAWAGMQQASLETRAKVQYLSITGPTTIANASPFLNTLIAFDCAVIVAAGDLPTKTVISQAGAHTEQPFILVGASDGHPNVTSVDTNNGGLSEKVSKLVAAKVSGKT